jgi:hypothetical protein
MGVSYSGCDSCGESKYEEYVGCCTSCGNSLCTQCLVSNDVGSPYAHKYGIIFDSQNPYLIDRLLNEGVYILYEDGSYIYEDGDLIGDTSIDIVYCPFCSGDKVDREVVLKHLLQKYKLDINKVWKEIKSN